MDSAAQLARTTLLFQVDLDLRDPAVVLRALTTPSILLVADEKVVSTLSGQVAITTAAMLMARSGHRVFIDVPDAPLTGLQPPMSGRTLYEAISGVGGQLINGVEIAVGCPLFRPDVAFVCGRPEIGMHTKARRVVSVGWSDWSGEINEWPMGSRCSNGDWPMGAMAAAVLMASEAVKISGRILTNLSDRSGHLREVFADCRTARLRLAPESTPKSVGLGRFDIISAGAVSNGFLYALLRLPGLSGRARVFDQDLSDQTNGNRNMLLVGALLHLAKVDLFKYFEGGLQIEPVQRHFRKDDLPSLADVVMVGVDDIPTRWLLAGARASWMGVGATSHFGSMASVHYPYSACAACLHPHDELQAGPVPTIAFVSFLSGLMVAADLIREISGAEASLVSRQRYVTSLQPAGEFSSPVAPRVDCPAGCPASRLRA
ncbi:MAG TPA: hypothetical protein VGD66_09175 [Allosphingosinicella sp.]|jgi:hypothetical protein